MQDMPASHSCWPSFFYHGAHRHQLSYHMPAWTPWSQGAICRWVWLLQIQKFQLFRASKHWRWTLKQKDEAVVVARAGPCFIQRSRSVPDPSPCGSDKSQTKPKLLWALLLSPQHSCCLGPNFPNALTRVWKYVQSQTRATNWTSHLAPIRGPYKDHFITICVTTFVSHAIQLFCTNPLHHY